MILCQQFTCGLWTAFIQHSRGLPCFDINVMNKNKYDGDEDESLRVKVLKNAQAAQTLTKKAALSVLAAIKEVKLIF